MKDGTQLTEDEIFACLDGEPDLITPEVEKEQERAASSICPVCKGIGGSLANHPTEPFLPNAILPNHVIRCGSCQALYDK